MQEKERNHVHDLLICSLDVLKRARLLLHFIDLLNRMHNLLIRSLDV